MAFSSKMNRAEVLTAQVMKCFANANHDLHWIVSKAKKMLVCSGRPENVCSAQRLSFGGGAGAQQPTTTTLPKWEQTAPCHFTL